MHNKTNISLKDKLNIIFINVDQLNPNMISGYGGKYARTPNIDRLIENGTSFMNSYTAEPVCTAARTSWWTGLFSSEHGTILNSTTCHDDILDLGQYLKANDYNPIFIGHWHMNGRDLEKSFYATHQGSHCGTLTDPDVTRSAKAVINNYKSDRPLFLDVGYFNPHDCCLVKPEVGHEYLKKEDLPPLLETYEFDNKDNGTVEFIARPVANVAHYSDITWRHYLYQYARLCEMIDYEIGAVLDELERSPLKDNTVILFTCDHGDGLACHKMKGKTTLWEESVRVPFIISTLSDKLKIKKNHKDYDNFASGTDIFPTVCEIAGIEIPEALSGISLYGAATGDGVKEPRKFAYTESIYFSRMVRTQRFKYIMDYKPEINTFAMPPSHATNSIFRELLYDFEGEGEKTDISDRSEYKGVLEEHRNMLFDMEKRLQRRVIKKDHGLKTLARNVSRYLKHFGIDYNELG